MISLDYPRKMEMAELHADKVAGVVRGESEAMIDMLYSGIHNLISDLPEKRDAEDFGWVKRFILADFSTLEDWVARRGGDLRFTRYFLDMYERKFAKSPTTFLDAEKTYNAYALLRNMDFKVCPYCDDEYIEIFSSCRGEDEDGNPDIRERRTCDIDHFYAKGGDDGYPAIAMCFFNLVPSGKGCNQTMNTVPIGASPHNPEIESWSVFVPDLPEARLLESLDDEEVKIKLLAKNGMVQNSAVLGLEDRYNHHHTAIRRLLELRRADEGHNTDEKERMGISAEIIQMILGPSYPELRGKELHQKLRNDLLGR